MGKYSALSSHLSLIQASFSKEQHNLRAKDLDHQDRQNFDAVLRITSQNVLSLLDEIPDSKGTKYYLQVTKSIVESFLNKELDPIMRIKEAWFALFFIRYWRKWLLSHKDYTLEKNFVSLNSYICIEINAHAIIILLLILRACGKSEYCLPWLLGSQPCERAFQAARSMTPTFSTMINFTVLGLIRRLHKLQIQVDLESTSDATGIIYPHKLAHEKKSGINKDSVYTCDNISNKDIEEAVEYSLQRARSAMEDLGMKELLIEQKQWDNASGNSQDIEVKAENIDDDEFLDVVDEYIPMISELDDQECKDVVDNLAHLEEKQVIDRTMKEKVTFLCQKSLSGSDQRTFIPLYKAADQSNKGSAIEKKQKLSHKYIELDHKGEKVYIRKSTLVWLFQEGERVSSDRLFRVRVKQPYSSSEKQIPVKDLQQANATLPQVQEHVELGDLCTFEIGKNSWKIGKIMQFANYKEKLKSNRQYKATKAPVNSHSIGVLCSWFQQCDNEFSIVTNSESSFNYTPLSQYICTLSLGCIEVTRSTKNTETCIIGLSPISKLYTASEFHISKEIIDMINLYVAEKVIKRNPCVTMSDKRADKQKEKMTFRGATHGSVIALTDDVDGGDEVFEKQKLWMTCCGFNLTAKERHTLLNGGELTDRIINAACAVLKKQFPQFGGLQTTLLQQSTRGLTSCNNAMQIIHLRERNHWAVISTIGCDKSTLKYYDSIFTNISLEAGKIIVSLLKSPGSINTQIMNVASQKGSTDCGVYCIAYCTSLAYKTNPCLCIFSQSEMRLHLVSCLEKEHFTQFPVLKSRRLTDCTQSVYTISVCPVCLNPDDGTTMVFCETCKEWYHNDCIPPFDDNLDWICETCIQNSIT